MARSRRGIGSVGSYVVTALVVVLGIGAGGYLATRHGASEPQTSPKPALPHAVSGKVIEKSDQTIQVYVIRTTAEESSLVPEKHVVSPNADKYEAALILLLSDSGTSKSAIPEGTKLLSLEVGDNLAAVDLSKDFVDNFSGGSEEESLAINAIVRTLSQFGDIKKVQILVEGKKIATLGGHFELEEPIDVNAQSQQSGEGQ